MMDKLVLVFVAIGCFVLGMFAGIAGEEAFGDDDDDDDKDVVHPLDPIYSIDIDPDDFVDTIDHEYYPMAEGVKLVYEGETEDGLEVIEVYNTGEKKEILGVQCTIVRDTVTIDGVLFEDTYDWFAQDKDGNVWYFGEDSTEYEDGEADTAGSWESGVDGAMPGIIMYAKPMVGMMYRQEYYEGEAEDMGAVISYGESKTVEYGTFDDLLRIQDYNPSESEVIEYKYYAKGIGVIMEEAYEDGELDERVELVDIVAMDEEEGE